MPAFIVSTSYTPYLRALCDLAGFPFEHVHCTELGLDAWLMPEDEAAWLREWVPRRVGRTVIEYPAEAMTAAEGHAGAARPRTPACRAALRGAAPMPPRVLTDEDKATVRELDHLSGRSCRSVPSAGSRRLRHSGQRRPELAALEPIVVAAGVEGGGVMYVGDSITDHAGHSRPWPAGGVSLSFNGNGYAIAAAEFAAASPDAEVQAQLAEAFASGGRDAVEAAVRSWPKPGKDTPPRGKARATVGVVAEERERLTEASAAARLSVPRRAGRAPRLTSPVSTSSAALLLTGVTVWEWDARTRRRQPILDDIDWNVGYGEQWAVIGPNGAGESTLLDVAAGMRHPSRGAVEILGERVGRVDLRALRERIGHVDVKTEEAFSARRTALDVVLTGATGTIQVLEERLGEADRERGARLLARFGCAAVDGALVRVVLPR